jgi:hypothetical protein
MRVPASRSDAETACSSDVPTAAADRNLLADSALGRATFLDRDARQTEEAQVKTGC